MKPLKLVIQAFGPFAQTETINFEALGENPLFLINGPTGSGKSSILDAICFALYGQTTGKDREASQMRCDFSSADLLTKVILTFSLGSQRYRIERMPTQERPKTKGEGFTTQQTTATLYQLSDKNDDKKDVLLEAKLANKTTTLIEELTGLNVEQFRQVMVLPQGKFREFLMADSASRESIFSKLFQTQIYKRIEDNLKQRSAGIRKDVEKLQDRMKGILDSGDLNTEDELTEYLSALKTELNSSLTNKNNTEKEWLAAEKSLLEASTTNKAFYALEKTRHQLTSLLEQQPSIDSDIQRLDQAHNASMIEAIQQQVIDQSKQFDAIKLTQSSHISSQIQLSEALNIASKNQDDAKHKVITLDKEKIELDELSKLIPKLAALSEARISTGTCLKQNTQSQADVDKTQHIIKSHKASIDKQSQLLKDTQKELTQLSNQQQIVDELKQFGILRKELDDTLQNKSRTSEKLDQKNKALKILENDIENKGTACKTMEFEWHNMQSSILAAELQHDTPCSVCGSLIHPQPATHTGENTITKDNIEAARAQVLQLVQQQLPIQSDVTKLETQLEQAESSIEQSSNKLGTYLGQTTEALREQYQQAFQQLKHLLHLQKQQGQQQKLIENLQDKLEESEAAIDSLQLASQQAGQAWAVANEQLQTLEKSLPNNLRDQTSLDQAIASKQRYIQTITKQLELAELAFNKASQQLSDNRATVAQQQIQIDQESDESTSLAKKWQQALQKQGFFIHESSSLDDAEAHFKNSLLNEKDKSLIQTSITQFKEQLSGAKASVLQQEEQLKDRSVTDLAQLSTITQTCSEHKEQALAVWSQHDKRQQNLINIQNKLKSAQADNVKLNEVYKVIGTLSDVANGQTGNKVSLQRFVLSVLLDDVLSEASQRLQKMSKGRYQLLRKHDKAKGNKASGLELEVEDSYTGKNRAVSTLSGGESFMAALALALGLSDVVQAYAGGIKLDTLFIDEGFGSLDQESLDLAIRTLVDLQASGRMIGIISHVSELKDQMALRIDVKHGNNSSEIMVTGS